MPAKMMEGRIVAEGIRSKIRDKVRALSSSVEPKLATILVGESPASKAYLRSVHLACSDVGINSRGIELSSNVAQGKLEKAVSELNSDRSVTGILLQLPLPKGLDDVAVCTTISQEKDVDGVNPCNLGLLYQKGKATLVPCTPMGVVLLLKHYGARIAGKHAVIINRSKLLGRPLAQLLLNEDATVTICHSKTERLEEISKTADLLLTGIGRRAEFNVGPNMVKAGAIVVDIGTSSIGGALVGDVDFDAVIPVASFVTPVPGGVGPMTIAMLMYNTLTAACSQSGVKLAYNPDELGTPGKL
ncbi:MAG: bifunctional 5,10-methylenetetrahydrofolate dehydrogenase/5,10-methenyltetrahydrofolate cyclohydrolase [Candidatus Bathyarchaeia archaeon]